MQIRSRVWNELPAILQPLGTLRAPLEIGRNRPLLVISRFQAIPFLARGLFAIFAISIVKCGHALASRSARAHKAGAKGEHPAAGDTGDVKQDNGGWDDRQGIDQRRDRLLAAVALFGGVGLALAIPFALKAGAEFFLPLTAALVVAIALVPFLEWMEARGLPSPLAALIALITFLLVANTALVLIVVPATEWFRILPERIPQIQANLAPVIDIYSQLQKFVDETVQNLANGIDRRHSRFGFDDLRFPAVFAQRLRRQAARVPAVRELVNGPRVATVVLDRVLAESQCRGFVLAVHRLGRIVKKVEDVLARVCQEQVKRLEPLPSEVLAFVDDDRLEAAAHGRDCHVHCRWEHLFEPVGSRPSWLRGQDARLGREPAAKLMER